MAVNRARAAAEQSCPAMLTRAARVPPEIIADHGQGGAGARVGGTGDGDACRNAADEGYTAHRAADRAQITSSVRCLAGHVGEYGEGADRELPGGVRPEGEPERTAVGVRECGERQRPGPAMLIDVTGALQCRQRTEPFLRPAGRTCLPADSRSAASRIPHAVRAATRDVEDVPGAQVMLHAVGLNPQVALQNLEMLVLSRVVMRGRPVPARSIGGLDGEYFRGVLDHLQPLTGGDVQSVSHDASLRYR